ncbi:hypothetical protein ceV_339 [Chrysochromulina ericina virus CeV-01B]|uniref:OTU domain-containing protein n=1 Tax=Chrysochromulina ericina virus CeV-01B TaxID=3070830 RepID=A0A0N9QAQ3_9VIRU|nr:hypothetical protein ceV_339 [Chrysochromulina ericina virus]ALH23245.1 hypothetical protein ceV_339 [Chrysochromulina ericina virus CeV-01B]
MDAIAFQAPINIKKMFIKDKIEQEKQQYLLVTTIKNGNKYNIYLTNKSPSLNNGELNLDGANLLLINYYIPKQDSFLIESLTKNELLENLATIFNKNTSKGKVDVYQSTSSLPESKTLTPDLTKSVLPESKTLTPDLTKSVLPESKTLTPDLTKSVLPDSELLSKIELGSSIGSSTKSSLDSISISQDWPDKCNIYLNKRDKNWIRQSFSEEYEIYDVSPDGNCFFYSFIEAFKFKLSLEDKNNIKYIPDKILEVLKSILRVNEILPDDPLLKLQEISNTLPSSMCSKYNLGVLSLRYILSLEANEEYFNTYIFRFDTQDEKLAAGVENITSLAEFKKYILTDKYWADEWAISTFQKLFNIQFVIFDETDTRLLGCNLTGEIYSTDLVNREILTVILNWTGQSHYQLVTYNDNALIEYSNLPEIIKQSCQQSKNGGSKNKKTKKKYKKIKKIKKTKRHYQKIKKCYSKKPNKKNKKIYKTRNKKKF